MRLFLNVESSHRSIVDRISDRVAVHQLSEIMFGSESEVGIGARDTMLYPHYKEFVDIGICDGGTVAGEKSSRKCR